MELKLLKSLEHQVARTREIVVEIRLIRSKEDLTDQDLGRLVDLRAELTQLAYPARYAFVDGIPRIDIISELIKIEKGKPYVQQHPSHVLRDQTTP